MILKTEQRPNSKTKGELGDLLIYGYQASKYNYQAELYMLQSIEVEENNDYKYIWKCLTEQLAALLQFEEDSIDSWSDQDKFNTSILDKFKTVEPVLLPVPAFPLENNCEMRLFELGAFSSITFKVPEKIPEIFSGKIFFRARSNCRVKADNFTYIGDSCENGQFVPWAEGYYMFEFTNAGPINHNGKPVIVCRSTKLAL